MNSIIKNKYDVVIVGAGPGGLRCAEILGRAGKKVLLLEKNAKIGPKICAGGLTRKTIKLLGIPDELFEKSFESVIFQSPSVRTRLKFDELLGATINREKLGQWQLVKLANSSVEIRTGANVIEITKEHVVIDGQGKVGYDFLVGADGSNSIVRKFLGRPARFIGVAFQYIVPRDFAEVEIHFDSRLFGSWYAWIFPYRGRSSIGYGCFPKSIPVLQARKNFQSWAEKNGLDISNGEFQAHPINCDYRGWKFGNIFLVGDAAGFVSAMTGEGIYQALVSGEEAANSILDPRHNPVMIKEIRKEVLITHALLIIIWLSGPLRNALYNLVFYCARNRFLGRTLARVLT